MFAALTFVALTAFARVGSAQNIITYPGWRGDNLFANGTAPQDDPGTLGINYDNGTSPPTFPFGQQFMFPCGGMPVSPPNNRTLWPTTGGAISVAPGLFAGHQTSQFFFNLGVWEDGKQAASNYSNNMMGPVEVAGPNNTVFLGQFCFPQVPMPANLQPLKAGTNVTIQVVQVTASGASLYNCVDATLVDPIKSPNAVQNVNSQNCYNSSDVTINLIFSTSSLSSAAPRSISAISPWLAALAPLAAATVYTFL